ncbi:MAG TPA: NADH-quinone oxidoreductase subunit NuoE [Deltaproteobacteria bacterium]|mgnify:FL=1|jgi:NADH-quinone oxidoreductase E subunit|nr:NADH-quinone oxidoreductase subunit NuoE [Deltaproteobacteria bacterium]HQJ08043.1 NADH-quinone oxidoreductase subunit NuoE [Deltaproteobacteria bacterium]
MKALKRPEGNAITDPAKQSMMLAALYIAQEQKGYLTKEAVRQVAKRLGVTPGEVYSTASFYTLFRIEPVGKHVIQVCEGLSCYLNDGAERVVEYVSAKLGIQPGETTPDGRFTLETVQCLASCGTAPAMRVNDQLYENLTPASIDDILERLRGEV